MDGGRPTPDGAQVEWGILTASAPLAAAPGRAGLDRSTPRPYAPGMPDDLTALPAEADLAETPDERAERIQWEAAVIAQAREEIAAGHYIDGDDLDAWFEALEHDVDAPFPTPKQGKAQPPHS